MSKVFQDDQLCAEVMKRNAGRVLSCYTNQQLLSSVFWNLSQSCSRQQYLVWASCDFSVEGCRSRTLGTAGAVLALQHCWKGVWGRMLAVFVERVSLVGFFFLSVACALGFLGQ